MKTLVFAVRHGETEWNLSGRIQGHLDSSLTARGVDQAHALADGLVGKGIEVIYSSDVGRAMQTANVIAAKLGLPIITDPRLRERHLGCMQGLTLAEFRDRFPQEYTTFKTGDPDYVVPDGESARQRYDRCVLCCKDLAARHPGQRVLIVAHGGILLSLFHYVIGMPLGTPRRFSLFNAAINTFSVHGGSWRLDCWPNFRTITVVKLEFRWLFGRVLVCKSFEIKVSFERRGRGAANSD